MIQDICRTTRWAVIPDGENDRVEAQKHRSTESCLLLSDCCVEVQPRQTGQVWVVSSTSSKSS